jgi:hypothetical protein
MDREGGAVVVMAQCSPGIPDAMQEGENSTAPPGADWRKRWLGLTAAQSLMVRYPLGIALMLLGWFVLHPLWAPIGYVVIVIGALVFPVAGTYRAAARKRGEPYGWRDVASDGRERGEPPR